MTKTQTKILNDIKKLKLADYREIKTIEIKENKYFLYVFLIIGCKNDAGTLASVFYRDSYAVFIGKRGKIKIKRISSNINEKEYNTLAIIH